MTFVVSAIVCVSVEVPLLNSSPHPEAVSAAGTTVTAEFTVKAVGGVMVAIVGFGGLVVSPVPAIPMPTESPVVLAQLIVGLVPSEQPVSETPAAVSDTEAPPLVGAVVLRTKVVELVTDRIVAPVGR